MYLPNVFAQTDEAALFSLVERRPFGTLIAADEGGALEIAHLPFLADPARRGLRVHVARANPIARLALAGRPLTAIFAGPHGYVSPRFYEHPDRQVPTWNYVVVHAHGHAQGPIEGPALTALLDELASRYEQGAWRSQMLAPELREDMLRQIVGFEIGIERLEGKWKLSQNRSLADQSLVAAALADRGGPDDLELSELMNRRSSAERP